MRLGREIALLLVVKLGVLYALWLAFFSQPAIRGMSEGMDPQRVATAVVSAPTGPGIPQRNPPHDH